MVSKPDDPRAEQLLVLWVCPDDEQPFLEQIELERQRLRVFRLCGWTENAGVPIAHQPEAFHYLDYDLTIGQPRNRVVELTYAGVEVLLRQRAIHAFGVSFPLDLASQERQVGAPALLTRHLADIRESHDSLESWITVKRHQV